MTQENPTFKVAEGIVDYNHYFEALRFEEKLKPGDECIARWTSCGRFYQTMVRIIKINSYSIAGEILAPLDGYPLGWHISCPRVTHSRTWSYNNRMAPVKEPQPVLSLAERLANLEKEAHKNG
jgi:hypothetical protein